MPIRPGSRAGRVMFVGASGVVAIALAAWATTRMDGPLGMIPGGAFHGAAGDCRKDWTDLAELIELELELQTANPRSVTIWSVVLDGELYLPADFLTPIKRWPHQLLKDPHVRIRTNGSIHRCRATHVTDAGAIAVLRREIATKYDLEPDGWAANTEVWWFRVQ